MEPKRRVDEDDNGELPSITFVYFRFSADIVEDESEFAAVAEEFVHALVDIVADVAVK